MALLQAVLLAGCGSSSSGGGADSGSDVQGTKPDAPMRDASSPDTGSRPHSDAEADATSPRDVSPPGNEASPDASHDAPIDSARDALSDGVTHTDATDAAKTPLPANPPQVVDVGGPVLAAPKLVPVFFSNDDPTFTAELNSFTTNIGASPYWAATTAEYGVGPATSLAEVSLTETAPATIDDSAIQTWLQGKLNGNDPAWPANDANTVYVLYYPTGTSITLDAPSGEETSCTGFSGYHSSTQLDSNHGSAGVAYAVIPRCASLGVLTGIDVATGAASAQLVESATNPYSASTPAYAHVDTAHIEWQLAYGNSEVGDMCAQNAGAFTKLASFPYTVQRTWSNAAETAGLDPCVPAPAGEVYFNSEPILTDSLMLVGTQVMGVKVAVGGSVVVPIDLFSDGATSGPWTVTASDIEALEGQTPQVTFSFNTPTGQSGDVLQMTIHAPTALNGGFDIFIVTSTLGTETQQWVGVVGN